MHIDSDNFADWIIYEDNHLLVVQKPAGVLSQANDNSSENDVLSIAKNYLKIRDKKPANVYLGLVHRLDRNTGGVLCLAKTSKSAARLSKQIRDNLWTKTYLGLAQDNPAYSKNRGWEEWRDYLWKDRSTNKSQVVNPALARANKAKLAVLRARYLDTEIFHGEKINLKEFELKTGRSHQIRVQAAARSEVLLNDVKYGGARIEGLDENFLGLWAYKLKIIHPVTKEVLEFTANPDDLVPWNIFKLP